MPVWLQICISLITLVIAVLMPLIILALTRHQADDNQQHTRLDDLCVKVGKLEGMIAACRQRHQDIRDDE